jgi:hypothetical protein
LTFSLFFRSILDFEEIVWEEGTAPVDNTDLAEEEWSSKW